MSAPIALYNHPDRQLIRRSCSGDAGSFCLLVRPYERAMYMIALSMAASPAEAEQIAQDGALRAYQTLSQFRGDEPFDLWLIRVTCSVARDALRKRDPLGHE